MIKNNRTFYSLLAFLTTAAILFVMYFSGIDVFAASGQLLDDYHITDNILYGSDTDLEDYPFLLDSSDSPSLQTNYHQNYDLGFVYNSSDVLDSSLGCYYIYGNTNNYSFTFFNCPNGSMICFDSSYMAIYVPSDYVDAMSEDDRGNSCVYYNESDSGALSTYVLTESTKFNIDGVGYYYYYTRYTSTKLMNSNMPIYHVDNIDTVTTVAGKQDYNNNTDSGGEEETSENNLYLEDGYFVWSTPDYFRQNWAGADFPESKNWFRGSVSFNYQLTDYQKTHPEEFTLRFNSKVSYYCNVFESVGNFKNFGFYDPFGGHNFDYPFSDIINKNSISLDISTFMTDFLDYCDSITSVNLKENEYDLSKSKFELVLTAEVVDRNNHTSSDYSDTLNFLNNTVKNNANGITNNNNPFVPSDEELAAYDPDPFKNQTGYGQLPSTNNTGTNGTGNNSIVLNNYNNRLIDPKPVVDYTKHELLPNEQDTNYVGLLQTVTHEDGFVNLLSNTFTFVPVTVWTSLSHYFTIMLTMIVAFFVLRLILDIL